MLVVVRCPGCRGAARVGREALGLLVGCPRCPEQFVAIEEAMPVPPPAPPRPVERPRGPLAPPEANPSRGRAEPVAPPPEAGRSARRRRPPRAEAADPAHHEPPAGGLPASVLIGLALLPFAIPLLWVIAPLAVGRPPVLSLAAPAALAIAASTLCLAVIYTVDWSPTTRIKGVVMLLGLAYFTGLSLYFLKKDMLDRVKNFFGPDREWKDFTPPDQSYTVKMPVKTTGIPDQPVPGFTLACHTASEKVPFVGVITYVVGSGKDPRPNRADDEWFDEVGRAMQNAGRGRLREPEWLPPRQGFPGRQWEVDVGKPGGAVRVVRVYRGKGTMYFLSVEGPNLSPDDEHAGEFFDKFLPTPKD